MLLPAPSPDDPLALPPAQREAIVLAHATPGRAYHDLSHVAEVLRHYRDVATGPGWEQPREAWLAILYHDAVYVPGRTDNEALSAQLAQRHIAQWLQGEAIDAARVAALIAMTARHGQWLPADFDDAPHGRDAAHFLDCDMAILGAEPAVFDAYDRGIAAEHRGVPAWLYRLNRRRFLKALLARDRIFVSPLFHARYDAQARANLRRAVTEKR